MKINQILESRDLCHVCGQTPCNCTHVTEGIFGNMFGGTAKTAPGQLKTYAVYDGFTIYYDPAKEMLVTAGTGPYKDKFRARGFPALDGVSRAIAYGENMTGGPKNPVSINQGVLPTEAHESTQPGVAEDLNEFASGGGGDSGDYLRALASAWYNGTFDSGSLQKGIKSQEDVERLLNRGIVCPDGKTRKLHIDYNSDFDGVEIYSDDYYNHGDESGELDSRTGQPWGPYDHMEFKDEELDEGVAEGVNEKDIINSGMPLKYIEQQLQQFGLEKDIRYFIRWAIDNGSSHIEDAIELGDKAQSQNPEISYGLQRLKQYLGQGMAENIALAGLNKEFGKFTRHFDRMDQDPAYAAKWNKQNTDRLNREVPDDDDMMGATDDISMDMGQDLGDNDEDVMREGRPKEKEADYGADYQDMVSRVKKLAGLGPLKTVYDPQKRVYKNVPTAVQPKKEQR